MASVSDELRPWVKTVGSLGGENSITNVSSCYGMGSLRNEEKIRLGDSKFSKELSTAKAEA